MADEKRPLISIIVPIYKVEEYLPECVESILAQSFEDFEAILVDDGSPDNCGNICDEYAKKDKRIRVIHKENGGLSDARNKGIDAARGQYLTFMDSDDTITENYMEYLYSAAKEHDADIVQASLAKSRDKIGTNRPDRRGKEYDIRIMNMKDALFDYLTCRTLYGNAVCKLYKREVFGKIRYPKGKLTEDEYTTYKVIMRSNTVVCVPERIYYYRIHQGSIVRSYSERRFEPCREIPREIREALRKEGIDMESAVDYKAMRLQLKIYNDFVEGGQYQNYKKNLKEIEDYIKSLPVDNAIWDGKYKKIRTMLRIAPGMYRKVVSKYRKDE